MPSWRRLCSCCCCFYVFDVCALLLLLLMLSPPLLLLLRLLMLLLLPLLLLPVVPLLLLLLLLEAPDNHPMPPVQRGLFGTQFVSPPSKQAKQPRVVRSAAADAVETQLVAQAAPQIPPAESQKPSPALSCRRHRRSLGQTTRRPRMMSAQWRHCLRPLWRTCWRTLWRWWQRHRIQVRLSSHPP